MAANTSANGGDPTASQLRHAIDSGKAGDKVPFSDPAASPLGTDAEAGGNPATPAEVALSLGQEMRPAGASAEGGSTAADRRADGGAAAGTNLGAPNTSQLRDAIDSGKAGDKVPYSDPAASPLGTDAEAGGNPATTAEVALSLAQETKARGRDTDANASAKIQLPGLSVGPTIRRFGSDLVPWTLAAGSVLLTLLVWLAMDGLGLLPPP